MKIEMELGSEVFESQMLQAESQKDEQEEQHFHVLAVDDSLIDRKLLERLLHVSSYTVTSVDSGDKALKYLGLLDDLHDNALAGSSESSSSLSPNSSQQSDGIKVNMIMTDYCMPGMSGYDLLKRVKGSSWKDVPVVVMSSENVPSRISMCLEGGAEEFLLKPLQLSDLEKLHPHLMKSINTSPCCCDQQQQSANSSEASNTTENIEQQSADSSTATNTSDDDDDQSSNKSSSISKRKAMSPEPPERSRPKTKGFGV